MAPTEAVLDPAVLERQLVRALADEAHERPQVLQVEQQQALVVGDLEGDREHAFLGVVQAEQPRQQQRPHLRDGGRAPDGPARRTGPRTRSGSRAAGSRRGRPSRTRSSSLGLGVPGWLMPDRSPFTSATNTGTPCAEKPSASTWSETVLPVPVAPAIRPWRLARAEIEQLWRVSLADQHGVGPGCPIVLPVTLRRRVRRPLAQASTVSAARTK